MTITSIPTRTCRTRRFTAISGLVLAVASLAGSGGRASAGEFDPAPVATFQQSCSPKGNVTVTLSNTAGLSAANFSVDSKIGTSGGGNNIVVAPGDTYVLPLAYGDKTYSVTVTADGGYTNSAVLDVDCTQTAATLVLICQGEQPMIEADATTSGPQTPLYFFVDGNKVDTSDTGTGSFTHPVVNGAAYTSALTTQMDGPIIDIAGIADCPPTMITVVTIPEPVVTVPAPAVTVPAAQPQDIVPTAQVTTTSLPPAALPSPPSAADALPVTGTYSTPIALIGAGLLGLGLLFLRATKRPQES
jgi:hypothetical protein